MNPYDNFHEILVAAGCDPEVAHELLSGPRVTKEVLQWRFWYERGLVSYDEYIKFLDEIYEVVK